MGRWSDFWNKKGWTTIKIRWIFLWIFILTVLVLWGLPRKKRYTELWDKANSHDIRLEKLERQMKGAE